MNEYVLLNSFNNLIGINKNAEIKNFQTNRILNPYIGIDNYQHVVIKLNGITYRKRVHRLMAEAFLNNCAVVDHIDGNKSNNNLDNLQSLTHSENIKKGYTENTFVNPHKGRGIWIIAINKSTFKKYSFKSMRECERFTNVDRHRIKTFLNKSRNNHTNYEFYYDFESVSTIPDECRGVGSEISTDSKRETTNKVEDIVSTVGNN